jgi:hypothetical protein
MLKREYQVQSRQESRYTFNAERKSNKGASSDDVKPLMCFKRGLIKQSSPIACT